MIHCRGNALKAVAPAYRQQNARPGLTSLVSLDGQVLETTFWQRRLVGGREETCSLHSGYFFRKLYLRRVRHEGRQMTVEAVIAEFDRRQDLQSKCRYAVARLKADCCLRNIPIDGRPVNTGEVQDCSEY